MRSLRDLFNPSKSKSWNVTTSVGTPGVDTNIPTEAAVRSAVGSGGSGNVTDSTAFGSEPGSPNSGDLDLYDNTYYIARFDGSNWIPWGPIWPMVLPVLADYSWVNQGGSTSDDSRGAIRLDFPSAGSDNARVMVKSQPSTPYAIVAAFIPDYLRDQVYFSTGLCFRESGTGKIVLWGIGWQNGLAVITFTNATTYGSNPSTTNIAQFSFNAPIWIRIRNDGTDLFFDWTPDGYNWRQAYTEAKTAHFTTAPDQVGFGAYINNGTYTSGLTLLSWQES